MMSMSAFVSADAQNVGIVPEQKGEKTFTLEDLNFGGTNYRNMIAKNRWCTWWGDQLVRQDAEECFLVDKATGKETKLFSVNEINQWIAPTKDIKVHSLYQTSFPYAGKSIVVINTGSKIFTIDFKKHSLLSTREFENGEQVLELNDKSEAVAYLKDNNLYVTR